MNGPFSESDMPLVGGRVYHLQIGPEEFSPNLIIVGDPDRAAAIAERFLTGIEADVFHRGLRTITGTVRDSNLRVTVTTSGMGTPSLEIVLNELVFLNEIDLSTRSRKRSFPQLNIIRVGTSGALQADLKLGTAVISAAAIGLDNTGLFYDAADEDGRSCALTESAAKLLDRAAAGKSRSRRVSPYASIADKQVVAALERSAQLLSLPAVTGLTISNAGFFGNQGRDVSRVSLTLPDLDAHFADFNFGAWRAENMEMETSFLLYFMGALKYRAGSICAAIANRRLNQFDVNYLSSSESCAKIALDALVALDAEPSVIHCGDSR